ncbi:hypothetical protein N0V90_003428 [Kalmusia sp. IMI 367209]|nr:hypothetical protein N0V90_003428 [Kalmusia sp. IMI 367209]
MTGPTGLLTSVLLTRYGITSLLTLDSKPGPVDSGHADGFSSRTLEILASLGLHHDLLDADSRFSEVSLWGPKPDGDGIMRSNVGPMRTRPSRFQFTTTVSQAYVERVLNRDLKSRSNPVRYGWRLIGFETQNEKVHEFPVEIKIQSTSDKAETKTIYAKYLIGADGAHSSVRAGMGVPMEGSSTDDIWGVVDTVVKTDFPDKRRVCPIVSPNGSLLWIPRERISPSQKLTRIYVRLATTASDGSASNNQTVSSGDTHPTPNVSTASSQTNTSQPNSAPIKYADSRALRLKVTLDNILTQIPAALRPYHFEHGRIDWWASYQVGQRMAPTYVLPPSSPRVLIAGDACHTHSPKAGQGANFGMADAQNLAWKLAYTLCGLVPPSSSLVRSYEDERLQAARTLLEFDKKWSRLFNGEVGLEEAGLRPEEFVRLLALNQNFVQGNGIRYSESFLVGKEMEGDEERGDNVLRPGRVLCSTKLSRFEDGNVVDSQDEMYADGKFRVLAMLPETSAEAKEKWWAVLDELLGKLQVGVVKDVVETMVFYPWEVENTEWTDFPATVREFAEDRVYGEAEKGGVYGVWDIERKDGALAVVRPDGYVGAQFKWGNVEGVLGYFHGIFGPM